MDLSSFIPAVASLLVAIGVAIMYLINSRKGGDANAQIAAEDAIRRQAFKEAQKAMIIETLKKSQEQIATSQVAMAKALESQQTWFERLERHMDNDAQNMRVLTDALKSIQVAIEAAIKKD